MKVWELIKKLEDCPQDKDIEVEMSLCTTDLLEVIEDVEVVRLVAEEH